MYTAGPLEVSNKNGMDNFLQMWSKIKTGHHFDKYKHQMCMVESTSLKVTLTFWGCK